MIWKSDHDALTGGVKMSNMSNNSFIPVQSIKSQRKSSSLKSTFVPNKMSALRKQKSRPENKLEPDINEIQRFVKRGI